MTGFIWKDGPRTIYFGRGVRVEFSQLLDPGYALLWSRTGAAAAPELADRATSVHDVASGHVDEIAAGLVDNVVADHVVVIGGGRVIDTAKAVIGARGGTLTAIPTTLSSAEMTWIHRFAAGYENRSSFVRPTRVLNDPALSASQPTDELAASSANALAHAIEGRVSTMSHPAARAIAADAERRIAAAWERDPTEQAREQLALAALLAGWVIDTTWYGMHHVLSQTLVRLAGIQHGSANAALLQFTIAALQSRRSDTDASGALRDLASRLAERAGAPSLAALGVPEATLERCADAALQRRELDHTPPRPARDEVLDIYRRALAG